MICFWALNSFVFLHYFTSTPFIIVCVMWIHYCKCYVSTLLYVLCEYIIVYHVSTLLYVMWVHYFMLCEYIIVCFMLVHYCICYVSILLYMFLLVYYCLWEDIGTFHEDTPVQPSQAAMVLVGVKLETLVLSVLFFLLSWHRRKDQNKDPQFMKENLPWETTVNERPHVLRDQILHS